MATKVHPVQAKTSKATKPITQITQAELIDFIRVQNELSTLKKEHEAKSENLKSLLGAGVPVEKGVHLAEITITERRNPKWREEAIELADQLFGAGEGLPWAEEVVPKKYEPTTSVKLTVK